MKVGDLVRHVKSNGRGLGVVISLDRGDAYPWQGTHPIAEVLWMNGKRGSYGQCYLEVVS